MVFKKLHKQLLSSFFSVLITIRINKLLKALKDFRQIIYSGWYNRLYKTKECFYHYPINEFIGIDNISIGENVKFGIRTTLAAHKRFHGHIYSPSLKVGRNCNFGDYINISSINRIEIGNGVLTGRWVTITDNSHGQIITEECRQEPWQRPLYSKGEVVIGDNVWIGDKVTILPNVHIGEGTIIGANSVVTKDLPSNVVAAGNPARIIKELNIIKRC